MNSNELKVIAEDLIKTFEYAGKESIRLYNEGLKIEIKEDKSPVSNGDLLVNEIVSKKISELTPNIKIISEVLSRFYKPDYYLVLPWHFKKEILLREKSTIKKGTKFIFPLPKLEIF